jgi:hypothetical protein
MPSEMHSKFMKTNSLKAKYTICSALKSEPNEPITVCDGQNSMIKREGAKLVSFTELHALRNHKIQTHLTMRCNVNYISLQLYNL